VNSKLINDEYIAEFITEHENYIDQHELTFFEVTTALAFKFFELNKTDFCVIETGLGGRLDATNVLNPLAVVISSISLEHTNVLGNTLREIATEKAAIIKRGAKVFTGLLKSEAVQVISEKCSQLNCELFMLKDYIRKDEPFIVTLTSSPVQLTEIPLKGKYQFHNAALAALAVSKTFESESLLKIEDGIKNVINNTNIHCRYEYLQRNPDIIFDSAHNPEAVENFINEFRQEDFQGKKVLLFGAMKDKAINEMLSILKQYFDSIFIAEIDYERFAKPEDMQNICRQLQFETSIVKDPAEFVRNFAENSKDDCLVVLGSMYLLGEIKSKLLVNVT
jgi:dihydrofolate synthase/folylpolyglutamate synthase